MKRLNIILAIDSYLIRKGITAILSEIPEPFLINETNNIYELGTVLTKHLPDFLIINDEMFNQSTDIYLANPTLIEKTILLKQDKSEKEKEEVKEYIYLHDTREVLVRKIESLIKPGIDSKINSIRSELSEREKTIVKYIATGLTNKGIANKLFLSIHTVITHRKNISNKLGIKSVSGLTVYAIVNNIISIDEISGMNE